jgi:hypothetical protein
MASRSGGSLEKRRPRSAFRRLYRSSALTLALSTGSSSSCARPTPPSALAPPLQQPHDTHTRHTTHDTHTRHTTRATRHAQHRVKRVPQRLLPRERLGGPCRPPPPRSPPPAVGPWAVSQPHHTSCVSCRVVSCVRVRGSREGGPKRSYVGAAEHGAGVVWFGEQALEDVGAAQLQVEQEQRPGRRHGHPAPGTRLHPHHPLPHTLCRPSAPFG